MNCAVEGCDMPINVKRLSLCRPHYIRGRRYGDPTAGGPFRPDRPKAKAVQDHPDGTRTCNVCEQRQPLDCFPKDKNGSAGHRSHCKSCHTAKQTARYNANPERYRLLMKQMRDSDLEKYRELDRQRYERDKPKRLALAIDSTHRRRALLAEVPRDRGISVAALIARDGDRCHYCRCRMTTRTSKGHAYVPHKATIEHILPLSRGGGHVWSNVVLACWQCNVRKNAKTESEWTTAPEANLLLW